MAAPQPPNQPSTAPVSSSGRPGTPITSASLLYRARQQDRTAWERLFYLYKPLVLYWCGRRGVLNADAEDVVQEVFRAVAGGLDSFHHDRPGDTFRGWLYGITRNHLLLHFRRAQHQMPAIGGSDALARLAELSDPAFNEEDPPAEISALYRRALDLVRDEFEIRTWDMFWQTVIDNRSSAAVAQALGVTAGAVRQAKSRVLRRLREEVGDLIQGIP